MAKDETTIIAGYEARWIGDRKVELINRERDERHSFAGSDDMDRKTILERALERAHGQAEGTITVGMPGEVLTTEEGHVIIGAPVATMKGQSKQAEVKRD